MRSTIVTVSSASRAPIAGSNTSIPNPRKVGTTAERVVNDQLDATPNEQISSVHQQHIEDVTAEILKVSGVSGGESEYAYFLAAFRK